MTGNKGNGIILQKRDWQVLLAFKDVRVLDRDQLATVGGYGSITRVNARAKQLAEAGLLESLPVGTVTGGRRLVYTLSRRGAELVGSPYRPLRRSEQPALSGDPFLTHQLQVSNVYATVKHFPIPAAGVQFGRWRSFNKPLLPNVALVPDGYFELKTPTGILCHFLEVDRGTEPAGIWQEKLRSYLDLALTGEFERQFRHSRFRVLVTTTTAKRLAALQETIRRSTDKLFWLALFEQVTGENFWSPLWLRPARNQAVSLV